MSLSLVGPNTCFKKAIMYADSLYALLAAPEEFEFEVSVYRADLYSVQIVGAGYPAETVAAFARLIVDWEARIRFHLLPEERIPAGVYALTFSEARLLVAGAGAVYTLHDRPVEVVLVDDPEWARGCGTRRFDSSAETATAWVPTAPG